MSDIYVPKSKRKKVVDSEKSVQEYLVQQLYMFCDRLDAKTGRYPDFPLGSFVVNTGGPRTVRGIQDVYADIGPCHLRIEVKTLDGTLSAHQRERHRQDNQRFESRSYVVAGKEGVDAFIDRLEPILIEYMAEMARQTSLLLGPLDAMYKKRKG